MLKFVSMKHFMLILEPKLLNYLSNLKGVSIQFFGDHTEYSSIALKTILSGSDGHKNISTN